MNSLTKSNPKKKWNVPFERNPYAQRVKKYVDGLISKPALRIDDVCKYIIEASGGFRFELWDVKILAWITSQQDSPYWHHPQILKRASENINLLYSHLKTFDMNKENIGGTLFIVNCYAGALAELLPAAEKWISSEQRNAMLSLLDTLVRDLRPRWEGMG
ncbi:MAG TPA: hypothetical protein DCY35_03465, partial [Prolixibacteraceae bacterium]|nr:hypothetical protein [Prolixibacteraceae bacterium]